MSTRLQVVVGDEELEMIRQSAKAHRQTVSDWVRRALRAAEKEYPSVDAGRKVQVVREAVTHNYPTTDVTNMLGEIERGYAGDHSL